MIAGLTSGAGLVACTDGSDPTDDSGASTTVTAISSGYRLEIESVGADERHELVSAVPVGRTARVVVSLSSQGEVIDVELEAEVIRADADGSSQDIELRVVAVRSDDPETVDGLGPIIEATSRIRRDARLAVVGQALDVPDDLGFRADAVVRQALRAPFSLAGPLPLEAVGSGASWTTVSFAPGEPDRVTNVVLETATAESYAYSFDIPQGTVAVAGRPGALLPERQDIVLDDAVVTITATPAG